MRDETAGHRLTEVPDSALPLTGDGLTDLLGAILAVASELELATVLERFVQVSAELTGARYGALNVLDGHGTSTTFVFTGVPTAVAGALRTAPHAQGVLGQIPETGVLRLDDLREHPAFRGFPREHPPMGSFLGASVRVGPRVFGQLYLSEKAGGFTQADEDVVVALAAAAGVAVANAQLYAEAERREHWLRAGQDITTMLLEGIDEEEALDHIAATALELAGADTAALALPGVGGELLIELAVGYESERILGARMPMGGRAWTVMTEGKGLLTPSLSAARTVAVPVMRSFGPALYAPLRSSGQDMGVLILLRKIGATPFDVQRPGDRRVVRRAGRPGLRAGGCASRPGPGLAARRARADRPRPARPRHPAAVRHRHAAGDRAAPGRARRGRDRAHRHRRRRPRQRGRLGAPDPADRARAPRPRRRLRARRAAAPGGVPRAHRARLRALVRRQPGRRGARRRWRRGGPVRRAGRVRRWRRTWWRSSARGSRTPRGTRTRRRSSCA